MYIFELVNDTLTLAEGKTVILGGSGVTIQLLDKKINRSFAPKVPRLSALAYRGPSFQALLEKDDFSQLYKNEFAAFENERTISRRLSHENIAQQYFGWAKKVPYDTEGPGFNVS